jgi:hypothetical protein
VGGCGRVASYAPPSPLVRGCCCCCCQIRFDFDPTYFGNGPSSAVAAQAIAHALAHAVAPAKQLGVTHGHGATTGGATQGATHDGVKLLFVFRDPAHQACSKLASRGKGSLEGAYKCWEAVGNITALAAAVGHDASRGDEAEGGPKGGTSEALFRARQHDFRQRLDGLRSARTCSDPWLANLHSFCYAEHVQLWTEVKRGPIGAKGTTAEHLW